MIDGHFELKDFSPDNYRLYEHKPDKDFSAKKNYDVINRIIKKTWKMRHSVDEKVIQNASNVADILSSFAKYKLDRDGDKKIEQWLGKAHMNRIYGEKLLEKLRIRESIIKLNRAKGNTKFLDYYLT